MSVLKVSFRLFKLQELVVHVGLEGLPFAEVATRLGLNYETVKKRWQRLRAKLDTTGLPDMLLQ